MKFIDPYGLKQKLGIKASEFTDPRDNKKYKTIIIDGVEWFGQNLDYDISKEWGGKFFVDLFYDSLPSRTHPTKPNECGSLYPFDSLQMACPEGWEIPDRGVFIELFKKITNLPPNEWKAAEKAKIYHAVKSILSINFCGSFNKKSVTEFIFTGSDPKETFLTSTQGSLSNGGSIFTFNKNSTSYTEDVGYGYYSVRPIRKNI
jgi:uncharacterized protein (TIGR02145 family)